MKSSLVMLFAGALVSLPVWAQFTTTPSRGNTDIVVGVPPSVIWGDNNGSTRREPQNNCMRCCVFENRNYTEGAVVRTEGVLLQCARDRQTLGTNNLIWQVLKQ
ncbi:MAG: DUF1496 domain-containing protein [Symbiopectobacterium sp.]|uniref:DUF1496 domain-containing protein n=1 Tax=Symbiopectobacterium sp. TaxID=2952789 RepID=UPI0039E9FF67